MSSSGIPSATSASWWSGSHGNTCLAEPGREAIYDAMLDVLERHDQLSVLE